MNRKCVNWTRHFGAALMAGLMALVTAHAQLPIATISGQVRDTSGAVIPGATVSATNRETGAVRTTVSNDSGRFNLPALNVGDYDINIQATSFRPETRQGLRLVVGQEAVLNFTLEVGSVAEAVTVTADAPLVDTTSGTLGGLVNEERVSDLPLNGRNFTDLVLLQTGINVHRPVSTTSSSARGLAFSSNGAGIYSNYMVMDGANLTAARGRNGPSMSGSMLGVEGIREFRVITNSFPAQYGVTMGSQITVVSKGGTNQFHGSAFEFLRNDKLDARDFFAPRKLSLRRNNFGAALGGPIKQDKLFFFVTYEGFKERKSEPHILTTLTADARRDGAIVPRVADAVRPYLALYPLPTEPLPNDPTGASGLGRFTFGYSQPTDEHFGQVRTDFNMSEFDNAFFRYTIADSRVLQVPGFPQFVDNGTSRGQYFTLGENHTFSPTVLNSFSLSYSRALELSLAPSDVALGFEPGLQMGNLEHQSGLSGIGPRATTPLDFRFHDVALSNDVFWSRGDHSVKFGSLIKWEQMFTLASTRVRGEYRFGTVANFLNGTANRLRIVTPGGISDRTYHWYVLGFYIQDDWRVNSRLTLNLGLRYEPHTTVNEIRGRGLTIRDSINDAAFTPGPPLWNNDSWSNWGPRFGFAWDVFGDATTAVRGGSAMLYDITSNVGNASVHSTANPPLTSSALISGAANLTFPRTVVPASAAGRSIRPFDWNLQQPHMLHWNLSLERQLPGNTAITVSYAASRGINLLQSKEGNPTVPLGVPSGNTCVARTSGSYSPSGPKCWLGNEDRLNPAWDDSEFKTAGGDSWYNSLQVQLNKRLARGLQFQSSYTWSKALDTTQGQFGGESGGTSNMGNDPDNPGYDKGPTDFDNRHAWTFNTLYELPIPQASGAAGYLINGWRVGTILTLRSGVPFSVLATGNTSRSDVGGGDNDRASLRPGVAPADTILGNPSRYYDSALFAPPIPGFLGYTSRNSFGGPALVNWDFSLRKDTPLAVLGEAGRLEFRAEFFNLLNHANFRVPNSLTVGQANSGQITRTVNQVGRNSQLALKVIF